MKILWMGDGGCTTGFGRVTHEVCNRLTRRGHQVDVLGVNYLGEPWDGYDDPEYKLWVPTKRNSLDTYGLTRIGELIARTQPDVLLILNDIPVIEQILDFLPRSLAPGQQCPPIVIYTPIDAAPLPDSYALVVNRVDACITYTRFGYTELEKAGADPEKLWIAGHGSDHADFFPVSEEHPAEVVGYEGQVFHVTTKEDIKRAYGFEGKYVILWADRNSERKALSVFLQAMTEVVQDNDDVIIYLHCASPDSGGRIEDLLPDALEGRVFLTPNLNTYSGLTDAALNTIYNMADVKVSTSMGEGWGLTNVEAVRCGVPVICQDFGPNREVLGNGAIYVPPRMLIDTPRGSRMAYPDAEIFDWAVMNLKRGSPPFQTWFSQDTVLGQTWDKVTDLVATALESVV